MIVETTPLREESLRRLHRGEIRDAGAIRALLERARSEGVLLQGGLSPLTEPRRARIVEVGRAELVLATEHFGRTDAPQHFLRFELDGSSYFFAGVPAPRQVPGRLALRFPRSLYESERRDLFRFAPESRPELPRRVELREREGATLTARVADCSYHGLGVMVPAAEGGRLDREVRVRFLDGGERGRRLHGSVRHRTRAGDRPGWVRIGLSVSEVDRTTPVRVDRRDTIFDTRPRRRRRRPVASLLSSLRARSAPRSLPRVRVIDMYNDRGERIRGILNHAGDPAGAPLVLVPPAWGRTKETLLPLALTLVESFRRAGRRVSVLRFDGTRRRGESYNHPDCLLPGREYLHFTVSEAVRDIHAILDHVESDPSLRPERVVLVTSSVSSVEGRRAIASDPRRRISGWISLVGVTDLQSALRIFSGGVDYGYGIARGLRFGTQELLGVACDLDRVGRDAFEHRLWFLEDARRDMARIDVPLVWIHGRHDAWMQLARAREILSAGDASKRHLIEIPTGHQLRTSRQALEAFRLVTLELGRMLLGRTIPTRLPDPAVLDAHQRAERRRLPSPSFDLRRFWRDYLVGRRGRIGIELMTATAAYRALMDDQIDALALRPGERVVDLGSGVGDFAARLAERGFAPADLSVVTLDFVAEGLRRGRRRAGGGVRPLVAQLEVGDDGPAVPLAGGSVDAVLASLVLGYLRRPDLLLAEVRRILRPGGRLVLSNVRRDADLSKIYVDSLAELAPDRARELFGASTAGELESLRQDFLNDAARIIDLEEFGRFRFWDGPELADLVKSAGFTDVDVRESFGAPPQAFVVRARRRRACD